MITSIRHHHPFFGASQSHCFPAENIVFFLFAAFNQIDPKHRIADGAHHCDSELSGLI